MKSKISSSSWAASDLRQARKGRSVAEGLHCHELGNLGFEAARYVFSPEAKEDLREIHTSKPWRILDLVEPVEAHFLDHAVGDHDQTRLRRRMVVEMLVNGEWRHVDEVAPFPREFLRLDRPLPFEGIEAVEIQVPVQVVAGAFDTEQHFLPHVAVLARALAGFEELHIGLD